MSVSTIPFRKSKKVYQIKGAIVAIVERTNSVSEHFFGNEKQHLRHLDYGRVFCGSLDHLPTVFAALDQQPLGRPLPCLEAIETRNYSLVSGH